MRTAIVYDRVNKWGGAERVLLALHELFPDAPLYTAVYSPSKATWSRVFPKVVPSFLQKFPFAKDRHEHFPYLMPLAFETLNFSSKGRPSSGWDEYDLVISVTSEAAKGIITKPQTFHICYCLTPTRYLWSHYDTYFRGRSLQAIFKPVVSYLRYWDKVAAQRPDVMVAISAAVQERIKRYYGRESKIVYPPVDVSKFTRSRRYGSTNMDRTWYGIKDNYYLIVSRLVPYKKVDLAIEAFNELGHPLLIVGTGSEGRRLKSRAKENINFLGFVSDQELVGLYKGARALVFPQEEDFGITAVEAQAAGIPVIAYKKGGALDIVIKGKTGMFFEEQTKESLIEAIKRFERVNFSKTFLLTNAQKFSKERFKKEFGVLVEKYATG